MPLHSKQKETQFLHLLASAQKRIHTTFLDDSLKMPVIY